MTGYLPPARRWCGQPETLLEAGEGCLISVVGDDLAVENEFPGLLSGDSGVDLGVGAGEILAVGDSSRTTMPFFA